VKQILTQNEYRKLVQEGENLVLKSIHVRIKIEVNEIFQRAFTSVHIDNYLNTVIHNYRVEINALIARAKTMMKVVEATLVFFEEDKNYIKTCLYRAKFLHEILLELDVQRESAFTGADNYNEKLFFEAQEEEVQERVRVRKEKRILAAKKLLNIR
jgi:hypothetical protein